MSAQLPSSNRNPLKKLYRKPGALVLTLIIIVLGAALAATLLLPRGERVNSNGYQVIYMTSGQAFFGKLKNTSGEYLTLDTPYTAQELNTSGSNDDKEQDAPQSTTLLKVSQQQYGPQDVLSLKSDQVLFWQNLRDDSKVAQAIKNAK